MPVETAMTPPGEITGEVLFYRRPEPLSAQAHGGLGFRPVDAPYAFAAGANILPLQVGEFAPAALSYPIIYAGPEKAPMAVLGVRQGENLFVNDQGGFEEGSYIPAFVRRYPFVLAANEADGQMIVCIDREAPMITEGGDIPLFENGQLSAAAQNAVEFCSNFETERQMTERFVARLTELDLFEPKATTFTPRNPDGTQGQPYQIADYFGVSEEKLNALSDKDLRDLQVSGALRQIHAQIVSLFNWERLMSRAAQRQRVAGNA